MAKIVVPLQREDISQFGVAYWHRIHQIPAIESCCDHQQQLVHVSLPQRLKLSVGLPPNLETEAQVSSYESHLLAGFAKRVLLEQSKYTSSFSLAGYREKLADLGYVTKFGRIRRAKLLSDFCLFTKKLQHPSAHVIPSSDSDYKYITNLLYDKYSQHIFKYLALGYWLSKNRVARKVTEPSKEAVFTSSQKIQRECLSLLKQGLSISAVGKQIGKSRTYVKGVAYASGLESLLSPTKLRPSVRSCIISLAWKGFHRFEIARRVSVSTGSVEMLISSVSGLVEWRKQCKHESRRRRYKCQLLRYRQRYSKRIRKDIKRDCNAAFYWLYLHEPDWLNSMLPEASQPHRNPRARS